MKTRQELLQQVEELDNLTIIDLEKQLTNALKKGLSTVDYYCQQDEYYRLKSKVENAGFKTSFCDYKSRTVGPKMTIYL